jgi:hypothetical protein
MLTRYPNRHSNNSQSAIALVFTNNSPAQQGWFCQKTVPEQTKKTTTKTEEG